MLACSRPSRTGRHLVLRARKRRGVAVSAPGRLGAERSEDELLAAGRPCRAPLPRAAPLQPLRSPCAHGGGGGGGGRRLLLGGRRSRSDRPRERCGPPQAPSPSAAASPAGSSSKGAALALAAGEAAAPGPPWGPPSALSALTLPTCPARTCAHLFGHLFGQEGLDELLLLAGLQQAQHVIAGHDLGGAAHHHGAARPARSPR